jgi:uncharacterized protein YkwD
MKRFVVVMTVWAMGLAGVLASVVSPSSASAATPTRAGAYGSLAPSRLLDTRVAGVGAAQGAVTRIQTVAAAEPIQLPSDWLAQMNGYRQNYGVPEVVEDSALSAADALHVNWMAVNKTMMHGEKARAGRLARRERVLGH